MFKQSFGSRPAVCSVWAAYHGALKKGWLSYLQSCRNCGPVVLRTAIHALCFELILLRTHCGRRVYAALSYSTPPDPDLTSSAVIAEHARELALFLLAALQLTPAPWPQIKNNAPPDGRLAVTSLSVITRAVDRSALHSRRLHPQLCPMKA